MDSDRDVCLTSLNCVDNIITVRFNSVSGEWRGMQVFVFKARDAKGRLVNGKVVSSSAELVLKEIQKKGLKNIKVHQQGHWQDVMLKFSIKARDRSLFYRQIATMLKAGVSITQAIEITRQTPNKSFKRILGEVSLGLENGYPFSKCLENYPQIFPKIEIGVLKAGEATGKMEAVLEELSKEVATSASFVAKVRGAMMYPLFILVVLGIVGVIVMTKIIPSISVIFKDQNLALPLSTQLLIATSDILIHRWYLFILGIVGIVALVKGILVTKQGKNGFSWLALNFPVFGQLQREVFLARFNRTFSLLLMAGVPIIESINIISTMTSNVIYHELVLKLSKSLEQGSPISTTMKTSKYIPNLMTQLLYVGQQTGDLSGMCDTLAAYYEEEVENKLRTFSSLLEPFIFVVLGGGVGFVVISILTPIYSLVNVF
jgi:type IV pilus assembly protein PilC